MGNNSTGTKCLPETKVPQAAGFVLHDWHAEILALRAFNHFLIHECLTLAKSPSSTSSVVKRREALELPGPQSPQPFTIREDVEIYMYCSEAPCGDASMELIMESQADATPWTMKDRSAEHGIQHTTLDGRGYFSELGKVRRKPSRPDSPKSLSKSCSDKLALRQCTSVLSSLACLLVFPESAYIESLVLPSSQFREIACDRAFGPTGRMQAVHLHIWAEGFAYRPFNVTTTSYKFEYSRRSLASEYEKIEGSNISAVWNPFIQETLLNGVLQGRKQTDPKGCSSLCNQRILRLVLEVAINLEFQNLQRCLQHRTYMDLKDDATLKERRCVKENVRRLALQGWTRNEGDNFALEQ